MCVNRYIILTHCYIIIPVWRQMILCTHIWVMAIAGTDYSTERYSAIIIIIVTTSNSLHLDFLQVSRRTILQINVHNSIMYIYTVVFTLNTCRDEPKNALSRRKTIKHIILFFPDLSECQLMQIPDAIYLLMQNTQLVTCDLSNNVISKLPAKFAERFPTITGEYIFYVIQVYECKLPSGQLIVLFINYV